MSPLAIRTQERGASKDRAGPCLTLLSQLGLGQKVLRALTSVAYIDP